MRKGIRNMCTGEASTSTLDQLLAATHNYSYSTREKEEEDDKNKNKNKTLEEMILELDLEECRSKPRHQFLYAGGRMSCVNNNNADILRNAALSQYPRFSLDGRDAMYRSSFRTHHLPYGSDQPLHHGLVRDRINNQMQLLRQHHHHDHDHDARARLTSGGDGVLWCKPGVVARLMGLDAMPFVPPPRRRRDNTHNTTTTRSRRTTTTTTTTTTGGDHHHHYHHHHRPVNRSYNSTSKAAGTRALDAGGWPTRRFRF